VPRILDIYRQGKHYFQLGDNGNILDFTYVENVAHGHLLAARALLNESATGVCGEVFLITNDNPIFFWDFCRAVWVEAGCRYELSRVWKIPQPLAMLFALISEILFAIVRKPSMLDRRIVSWCCSTRYYNIAKAKSRLGYVPLVSMQEGIKRCVDWCKQQEEKNIGSKAHM
jgi:sterol-4alpha-carboxylate 3-dehydrogenase (decarboxylating)